MVERVKVPKRPAGGDHGKHQGRPVGSPNKVPMHLRGEMIKAHRDEGGLMPVDFMLQILRCNRMTFKDSKSKKTYPISWEDKKWAAGRLLHCFTPQLTTSTLKATVQVFALPPEALKDLSDEELLVMEKALQRLNPNGTKQPKLLNNAMINHLNGGHAPNSYETSTNSANGSANSANGYDTVDVKDEDTE